MYETILIVYDDEKVTNIKGRRKFKSQRTYLLAITVFINNFKEVKIDSFPFREVSISCQGYGYPSIHSFSTEPFRSGNLIRVTYLELTGVDTFTLLYSLGRHRH